MHVYSGSTISLGESSSLYSFDFMEVTCLFLSEGCLPLERAAEVVEEFLGPPTTEERGRCMNLVVSWKRYNHICFHHRVVALVEPRVTGNQRHGVSGVAAIVIPVSPLRAWLPTAIEGSQASSAAVTAQILKTKYIKKIQRK